MDLDVNLFKPPRPSGVETTSSQTDLVARVGDLIDARDGGDFDPDYHTAAVRALRGAQEAERRIAELTAQVSQLQEMALSDELTGLLNRRGFLAELGRELAAARRFGEPAVLVYIDLDGFKQINDRHGHAAGDAVLRRFGEILTDNIRAGDCVGRLGGDEFAVLLSRADGEAAEDGNAPESHVARLETLLNSAIVVHQGQPIRLRASLGARRLGGDDAADILAGADRAMYRHKRGRRAPLARAV